MSFFIAERTIEHHMLSILKFKKALFAGALDGGEDSIHIGQSRLSKCMESIEEFTRSSKDNPVVSADAAVKKPAAPVSTEDSTKSGAKDRSYQDICAVGATLLKALASGLEQQPVTVEKDAVTGRSCLKVPLPDESVLRTAMPVVEGLLDILKGYLK